MNQSVWIKQRWVDGCWWKLILLRIWSWRWKFAPEDHWGAGLEPWRHDEMPILPLDVDCCFVIGWWAWTVVSLDSIHLIWFYIIWFWFWFNFDSDLILILYYLILIWFELILFDFILLDLIWFWFDLILFDIIWFDFDSDLILIWYYLILIWLLGAGEGGEFFCTRQRIELYPVVPPGGRLRVPPLWNGRPGPAQERKVSHRLPPRGLFPLDWLI